MNSNAVNKSFMNLSKKECLIHYKSIFNNSANLYVEAELLANNQSYGRGVTLLILSMEESMKAIILFLDGHGFQFRQKVKGLSTIFKDHRLRYGLAMVLSIIYILSDDFKKAIVKMRSSPKDFNQLFYDKEKLSEILKKYLLRTLPIMIKEINWFSNADVFRQETIYVDFKEKLISPEDISLIQYEDVKTRVHNLNELCIEFFDALESSHDKISIETKEIQVKFINKGWYEMTSKLLDKFKERNSFPFKELSNTIQDFLDDIESLKY